MPFFLWLIGIQNVILDVYLASVFLPLYAVENLEREKAEEKEKAMITIYSMDTCPDCMYLDEQIRGREEEFQKVNIGEHVRNLKEFLRLRDNSPVFDECRKNGYAGIPCFVREDGSVTLIPEEAGLKSRPAENEREMRGQSCRLDGTGC